MGHVLSQERFPQEQPGQAVDAALKALYKGGFLVDVVGDQASKQTLVGGDGSDSIRSLAAGAPASVRWANTEDRSLCPLRADGVAGSGAHRWAPFGTASIVTPRIIDRSD